MFADGYYLPFLGCRKQIFPGERKWCDASISSLKLRLLIEIQIKDPEWSTSCSADLFSSEFLDQMS